MRLKGMLALENTLCREKCFSTVVRLALDAIYSERSLSRVGRESNLVPRALFPRFGGGASLRSRRLEIVGARKKITFAQ